MNVAVLALPGPRIGGSWVNAATLALPAVGSGAVA
jgi:hypothetical protein